MTDDPGRAAESARFSESPFAHVIRQPLILGLFLPVQSGGWSASLLPRTTDWTFNYNAALTRRAEALGFDLVFGLAQTMAALPAPMVRGVAALGVLVYAGIGVATMINGGAFLDYRHLFGSEVDALAGEEFGVMGVEAGVMLTVVLGASSYGAGNAYLLPAFAAAFLGSTQIRPGRFNVAGTLVAIYLLAIGVKGLQLQFPQNPWISDLFNGGALIIAVALSQRSQRRRARSQSGA